MSWNGLGKILKDAKVRAKKLAEGVYVFVPDKSKAKEKGEE